MRDRLVQDAPSTGVVLMAMATFKTRASRRLSLRPKVHSDDCRRGVPVRATPSAVLKALDPRHCLRCRLLARMLEVAAA